MIPLKHEGMMFEGRGWQLKHPARWCKLKFLFSALSTRDVRTPRGVCFQWQDHCFTCYMRIRWHMIGKVPLSRIWEHIHRDWVDPEKLRKMVEAGMADDIFLRRKAKLTLEDAA